MHVAIDPVAGTLIATASLDLAPAAALSFFLNRDFEIDGVEVDGAPVPFTRGDPDDHLAFSPASRRFSIPSPPAPGETMRLVVRYHGSLPGGPRSISRITPDLTELNLYAAWFPILEGPQGFDYVIEVEAPQVQRLVTTGAPATTRIARGRSSGDDVPLILSSAMREISVTAGASCRLEIVSADLPGSVATWLPGDLARGCEAIASRMRPPRSAAPPATVTIAIVPREGDGYARPPLVVIPTGWLTEPGLEGPLTREEKDETLRRILHEIGHAFAPLADTHTYDDWINEGLAEDFARRALDSMGEKTVVDRWRRADLLELASRKSAPGETIALLPPISATRRVDPDARLLYYTKGAMIFRMIASVASPEALDEALQALAGEYPPGSSRRLTTDGLVTALQKASGLPFGWLRDEWVHLSGLPEIESELRVGSGSVEGLVTGEVRQTGARTFRLLIPVEARGGGRRESRPVRLGGRVSRVEVPFPFRVTEALVDPDLTIPRIDPTVREALALLDVASRSAALAREGLAAERAGRFEEAMRKYRAAQEADPRAVLPRYREGRVDVALKEYAAALMAHEETARIAERRAREDERLRRGVAEDAGAAEFPPPLWLPADPDLRSWNQVRIGQIHDLAGRRSAALRAYRRALDLPDLRGAHEEASKLLAEPYRASDLPAAP
ncbi:MAG: hypothetical protein HY049_07435 [Acidobacteria bacterium]|nr:hypothetical protein [Acidobacteriota bacterium]